MKTRFLALLLILGAASASVLIYASRSGDNRSSATLGAAMDKCESCAMATTSASMAGDHSAMLAKPEVATLVNGGCPHDAAHSTLAASIAAAPATATAALANTECCDVVAPTAPAH